MRRLLAILLLTVVGIGAWGIDFYGQTVNFYEDFEDALNGSWTETDASSVLDPQDAAAKYAGTYGMSVDLDGDALAYLRLDTASESAHVSVGFWYKTVAEDLSPALIFFRAFPGSGYTLQLYEGTTYLMMRGADGYQNAQSVSNNTWYWITVDIVQNDTSTLRVYDTSHNEVGTAVTTTANNTAIQRIDIGRVTDDSLSTRTGAIYFDEFVEDHDGGVYPILGWAVGATTYAVTYDGNTSTGGTVPEDGSSPYEEAATVTVLTNSGTLVKTGYTWVGWNTAANGTGTDYDPADEFAMPAAPVTLYAQWAPDGYYYVDYTSGSDSNTGITSGDAFKHSPGDANATGVSAAVTLAAGDVVYFRKGITYEGQITPAQSGSAVVAGSTGAITAPGVLTDTNETFETDSVAVGDQVYIYHSKTSVTATWVESVGLFTVGSIDSETQITLSDFDGVAHATAEMTYVISRPITYTSTSWGTGAAIIDGGDSLDFAFDVRTVSYLRFEGLTIQNYSATNYYDAAIYGRDTADHIYVVSCVFDDLAANTAWIANYGILKGCTITDVVLTGFLAPDFAGGGAESDYQLIDNNTLTNATRSYWGGYFTVYRYNTVTDLTGAGFGYHGDAIGPLDNGAGPTSYVWIYGNTIDNSIEFFAIYGNESLPSYVVIHSNVIIGRYSTSGYGDNGILGRGSIYIYVLNNTWVGPDSVKPLANYWTVLGGTAVSDRWFIENNIFVTTSGVLIKIDTEGATNFTCDYNHYVTSYADPFRHGGSERSYAYWTGTLGYDANSISDLTTDPSFTDSSSLDFTLSSASPDIGAGTDLSSMFTLDHDGDARVASDLGAYRYSATAVYAVSYNGNTSTGGTVPVDASSPYSETDTVTVLGNTGTLVKTGYTFNDWDTAANGTGTAYDSTGTDTFAMPAANVTLYAQWVAVDYTLTYDGNTNTGGTVPVDGSSPYNYTDTVTVAGNTGTLVKTGYTWDHWDTQADDGGTNYAPAAEFAMPAANTVLYAQWAAPVIGASEGNASAHFVVLFNSVMQLWWVNHLAGLLVILLVYRAALYMYDQRERRLLLRALRRDEENHILDDIIGQHDRKITDK